MSALCEQCGSLKAEYIFMGVPTCHHCLDEYRLDDHAYAQESFEDFIKGAKVRKIKK